MKLFNKYETNIEIQDLGLKNYINLSPLMVVKTTPKKYLIKVFLMFSSSLLQEKETLICEWIS